MLTVSFLILIKFQLIIASWITFYEEEFPVKMDWMYMGFWLPCVL